MKKEKGIFTLELFAEADGFHHTLWVVDIHDTSKIFSMEICNVEAETMIEALDKMYGWVQEIGYDLASAKLDFVVWELHILTEIMGRQGEPAFLNRNFLDFVSYYAGQNGIMYNEASDDLMKPIFGTTGEDRAVRLAKIFYVIKKRGESHKLLLSCITSFAEVKQEMDMFFQRFPAIEKMLKPGEEYPKG